MEIGGRLFLIEDVSPGADGELFTGSHDKAPKNADLLMI
jgi:hypothetical protein